LATIAAEEAQASAIIQITTESLEAFKKLNA